MRYTSKLKKLLIITLLLLPSALSFSQVNFEYFLAVGRYKLRDGNYVEAIKSLNTAIMVDKNSYDAYFYRGLAKYSLSDYAGAKDDLDRALTIQPMSK